MTTHAAPNFLFIGPDKAGSTWLYEALRRHDHVYLSSVKELFFFDRFYHKGWHWYARYFRAAKDHHCIVGEICHDYLFSRLACERIAHDLPNAKLMVCLREPAERAFSEYLYRLKVGVLACDFESALREANDLIDHGCYAKHLSCYLQHFKREQLHVALFDDLATAPQAFFDGICDFLGLKRLSLPAGATEKILPAARPRIRTVAKLAKSVGWRLRHLGIPRAVAVAKESRWLNRALYSTYEADEKPKMPTATKEFLKTVFLPDVQRLDNLLGTDLLTRWRYSDKNGPKVAFEKDRKTG